MQLIILAALALAAQAPADHDSVNIEKATELAAVQTAQTRQVIPGGASQRHFLAVRAGQLSQVSVSPARNRAMEIYLFDAGGKLLAADLDASNGLSLGVRPGWEGPFTLVVRNTSRQGNMYTVEAE